MLRGVKVIIHIAILYGIYLIGDFVQLSLGLFIPGSVIGLLILFVLLMTGVLKVTWIEEGTKFIIKHLTFFFIPATVGVISYFDLFAGKGILLILIILISTVLVMAGSGLVSQWLMRKEECKHD
ncbi:CidA/LrgA family protein [Virgibacillus sp. C22-A2]|uniref:CidA/LrgA family protein n=1 Tax=Virgibacillus tibetensis TaxID=3042313 RepID=A0ABU6KGG4_9BACI|nr:CidA/LrgA family protein [Virgibacillus sp. C22-A2]